ncbi:alpha/beta fold hydrolase [uncultured Lutibacter sp.]|uniref:dienelactone hydrolase family protein n=1 Tax=uncultured Lutibacter sp. TaxID=437739 RepID=UPI00262B528C|nr:alpha/beta fold hydrolase [uncultured Lutibacter sp.]
MNIIETFGEIKIPIGQISLRGSLRLNSKSKGIVLFSHGSGSSRLSIRNNYVANLLLEDGFSSLLFDLLTTDEDKIYENRFNIQLLTDRLLKVTDWIRKYKDTKHLPIGYFGASTGAASALSAAAKLGTNIKAVVSRGGRPDLALEVLKDVKVPTLLLVGGNDTAVIDFNKQAQSIINGICELKIIEGATHLFSEHGKLELVAQHTSNWFDTYLKS